MSIKIGTKEAHLAASALYDAVALAHARGDWDNTRTRKSGQAAYRIWDKLLDAGSRWRNDIVIESAMLRLSNWGYGHPGERT